MWEDVFSGPYSALARAPAWLESGLQCVFRLSRVPLPPKTGSELTSDAVIRARSLGSPQLPATVPRASSLQFV